MTEYIPKEVQLRICGQRRCKDDQLQLVASGFINLLGVHFIDKKLWVTEVNSDFIGDTHELPDGFIVEVSSRYAMRSL